MISAIRVEQARARPADLAVGELIPSMVDPLNGVTGTVSITWSLKQR